MARPRELLSREGGGKVGGWARLGRTWPAGGGLLCDSQGLSHRASVSEPLSSAVKSLTVFKNNFGKEYHTLEVVLKDYCSTGWNNF